MSRAESPATVGKSVREKSHFIDFFHPVPAVLIRMPDDPQASPLWTSFPVCYVYTLLFIIKISTQHFSQFSKIYVHVKVKSHIFQYFFSNKSSFYYDVEMSVNLLFQHVNVPRQLQLTSSHLVT